ncbi:minor capsid protein [Clostridium perfringens]|nr:minor capsid protein [Clostridium perfringens]
MVKNRDYWRMRFEQLEESLLDQGDKCYQEIKYQYQIALSNIEKDLSYWYHRFAINNETTLSDVNRLLNSKEIKELKWTVQEYIKYGQENAINQMWMKELENASAKAHITRLEAMKLQVQHHIEILYDKEIKSVGDLMKSIYENGYYHTAFEIAKGIGVVSNLAKLDDNRISKVINKPWTTDGLNFSKRIWGKHRPQLINELHTHLTQSIIRGEDPQKAINAIAKKFDVSKKQAGNLIMTESAFFASASQKDCYNDLDVEKYEIVATLDLKTSKTCRYLDGKVFEMKDYEVGVTAPPFHNYCRTVTAPYFDDEFTANEKRIARNSDGQVYYIDSNMKYNEWYDKSIKDDSYNDKSDIISNKKWLKSEFSTTKKFKKHIEKHINEYGNIDSQEYLNIARKLLSAPLSEDVEGFDSDLGFIFKYRKSTNDFAIGRDDGYISTLYKPKDGYDHWLEEKEKYRKKV